MSNNKQKSVYTIKNYLINMFIVGFVIFEAVLYLGNVFTITEIPELFYRYIPTFITGFLVTYLMVKSASKKLYKKDASMVKKVAFIAPIAIGLVMFLSEIVYIQKTVSETQSNLSRITSYSETKDIYKSIFGETIEEKMDKARSEALLIRFFIFISYVAGGELGALLSVRKVDSLLQDDVIEASPLENSTSNLTDNQTLNNSPNTDPNTNSTQNINWNL